MIKTARLKLALLVWLALAGAGWLGLSAQKPETPAVAPTAGPIYLPTPEDALPDGAFLHDQHPTGEVAIVDKELIRLNGGKPTIKLDCNYCHLVGPEEVRADGFGKYPLETPEYLKRFAGRKAPVSHSACAACHSFMVTPGNRARLAKLQTLCAVCHNGPPVGQTAKDIHPFPNPTRQTQFGALYSHAITAHAKESCESCHQVQALPTLTGSKESPIRNVYASRPEHRECFACHIENAQELTGKDAAPPYATDCAGCHPIERQPDRRLLRSPRYTAITLEFQHDGHHAVFNRQWNPSKPFETIEFLDGLGKVAPLAAMTHPDAAAKQTALSCKSCHGNLLALTKELRDARPKRGKKSAEAFAKEKLEWDWLVQTSFRRNPTYPTNLACAGCHGFERIEKVNEKDAKERVQRLSPLPGFAPAQHNFIPVFNVGSCDSCHPSTVSKTKPESHKLRRPAAGGK
ncbi:MAG: hypothetical protein CFK52_08500 [Chloracidobacterium sp. CP2_5A]|nr:MAG: hypothetical protein CFK52_08500 [Chloracidobacterium sp. CP2_5A]